MDIGFPAERTHIFQAPIKLAQPFPAPELRAKHFTDTRIFLTLAPSLIDFGRFANGHFRNRYFDFQFEERCTTFKGLVGRLFLSEGSSLFPPFLFLSGGVLGTFHGFSKYQLPKYLCILNCYPINSKNDLVGQFCPLIQKRSCGAILKLPRSTKITPHN